MTISSPMSITSNSVAGIQVDGGALTVNSGTISGPAGIYITGGSATVKGGNITGTSQAGINIQSGGTLNLSGGTIYGETYGVENHGGTYNKSGSPTISGKSGAQWP